MRALFLAGGWDGHQPETICRIFAGELEERGFTTETATSLDVLADEEKLRSFDLIFPCWTMSELSKEQGDGLQAAVRAGVGLAGIHGGMGDAFRGNLDFEWMVGGHFVGHPHVGDYTVRLANSASPITEGVPSTFAYNSEQYYMLIDPAVHVLAETEYVFEGRTTTMPVAWTKAWGEGRVFYSSLGHAPEEFTTCSPARLLTLQGLLWAARLL